MPVRNQPRPKFLSRIQTETGTVGTVSRVEHYGPDHVTVTIKWSDTWQERGVEHLFSISRGMFDDRDTFEWRVIDPETDPVAVARHRVTAGRDMCSDYARDNVGEVADAARAAARAIHDSYMSTGNCAVVREDDEVVQAVAALAAVAPPRLRRQLAVVFPTVASA